VSSETIAIPGALIFCLFPADTTHTFLTHAFHLQTSITFLLVASLLYLSGKRVLPYLVIIGSLLAYESPFMVFLAVPLLRKKVGDYSLMRELTRHIAILVGIILVVVVIRISLGEYRVMQMGETTATTLGIPVKIGLGIIIGPLASLALFLYGPIRTLLHWNWPLAIVFVASLPIFIWVLHWLKTDPLEENRNYQIAFHSRMITFSKTLRVPGSYAGIAKLLLVGVIMLCLAYVFSFTHFPPWARYGRMTSVHLAASVGGSIVFACVCSVVLSLANAYRLKKFAIVVLALYLSLVVAYRFSIQLDFKQAWQNQRTFWTGVIENVPDLTDETIVFVLDHDLPKTRYILSNSWADRIMLSQLTKKRPNYWDQRPWLYVVRENDWPEWYLSQEKSWISNVILLEMEEGRLVRRFGSRNIKGQDIALKPIPLDTKLNPREGPLYDYLIYETKFNHPPISNGSGP
jgi:hypothetical protein